MNRERRGAIAFIVLFAASMALAVAVPEGRPGGGGLACHPVGPPIYPGAEPIAVPADAAAIMHEVGLLGRTPPLAEAEAWLVPGRRWLAAGNDIFSFYERRMTPVTFDEMTRSLRELLGLRPTGLIDSPPLLYLRGGVALLIRTAPSLDATLLVMHCAPTG